MSGQRLDRPDLAPTISAVVLTLNEEQNLDRCLASLKWCHDLVVVDSGSTDATANIAQSLGARLYIHPPDQPYRIADQRNWAVQNCEITSDWILFLDADEEIPDALAEEIGVRIRRTEADAFQLTPKYLFMGKWMRRCMGYPNWHDRLVRRGKGSFTGGVWEHFSPETNSERIGTPYLHYGNSKGFSDWLERHDRYSSWEADSIVEYLDRGDSESFGDARKLVARRVAARLWPFRPVGRFLMMYAFRGGFLEGRKALLFCFRYAVYEYMTVEKVIEARRTRRGKPL